MHKDYLNERVVIFIFRNDKKILVEKRHLEEFEGPQYLIPGGRVKEGLENLEEALAREVMEELAIKPLKFNQLLTDKEIRGLKGHILIPFLINKWEGQFPEIVLDRNTPLCWVDFEELLNSPVEPTRKIAKALKRHLDK